MARLLILLPFRVGLWAAWVTLATNPPPLVAAGDRWIATASPTAGGTGATADLAVATAAGTIYVAAADGSGGREVASGVCEVRRGGVTVLALAPDGRCLAFACSPRQAGPATSLYLTNLVTDSVQHLADAVSDAPGSLAWSPDGRYLAYQRRIDLGPAPVAAAALWVHDVTTGRQTQLDAPRYFAFQPVWTPDGSAVVYLVGDWFHSSNPVATYRAPLDGSGGTPWRQDIRAAAAGPAGQWLGARDVRGQEPNSQVFIIAADGTLSRPTMPPADVEYPLGWLGPDPVVWREATPATAVTSRGEVWLAGGSPRRLLTDVPRPDVASGPAVVLAGSRLLYAEQNDPNSAGLVWLVDLATGGKRNITAPGRAPVALRAAVAMSSSSQLPAGMPPTGAGGAQVQATSFILPLVAGGLLVVLSCLIPGYRWPR